MPIVEVMKPDVQTIGPEESVRKAALLMRKSKIGCLPVMEHGKIVGIISEFDLLGIVENL